MNKEHYQFFLRVLKIANRAVKKAQDENRRLGLPNVYARNGKVVYELPDGTLSTINPIV